MTLNGKEWRESITDFRKAFSEANDIGVTKKGTLFSWLTGNFNNDYDFVKDLDADTEALKKFKDAYTNESSLTFKKKNESFDATLKNSSVILQDFVKHTDKANISVENFFSSVTGAGKLTNAIKGIGLQMLTTAAQAAAIWAITEGFRLAVNAVQDYVNRAEIAKEKMEESKQAYRFTMTSTNFGSNSMPRHTWSVFSPAISVEPLPRNGSVALTKLIQSHDCLFGTCERYAQCARCVHNRTIAFVRTSAAPPFLEIQRALCVLLIFSIVDLRQISITK